MAKKKTFVEDIERTLYDIRNEDHSAYKSESGLTPDIIRDISRRKHDPAWMTEFRLKSLEVYHQPGARTSPRSTWTRSSPMSSRTRR